MVSPPSEGGFEVVSTLVFVADKRRTVGRTTNHSSCCCCCCFCGLDLALALGRRQEPWRRWITRSNRLTPSASCERESDRERMQNNRGIVTRRACVWEWYCWLPAGISCREESPIRGGLLYIIMIAQQERKTARANTRSSQQSFGSSLSLEANLEHVG